MPAATDSEPAQQRAREDAPNGQQTRAPVGPEVAEHTTDEPAIDGLGIGLLAPVDRHRHPDAVALEP